MTLSHAHERSDCHGPIAALRDLPILFDCLLQIPFDLFFVLRSFELRLDRPRRLRQGEHRCGDSEYQRERDESLHRASSDEGRRRSSELQSVDGHRSVIPSPSNR